MSTVPALDGDPDRRPDFLWRDGQLVPWGEALVHVNAVGHASVSGIFEGIKAYRDPQRERLLVFRLDDHMRRFVESFRLVHLEAGFDARELARAVLELLRANRCREDTYVRPTAFVRGLVRELIAPAGAATETIIDCWPFRGTPPEERGCTSCVSSWRRIGDDVVPIRAKAFSNYHNGRMGLVEAAVRGADWPVFLNAAGLVTEAPGACLFAVRDGVLRTPRLVDGVLDGITRDTVLTVARDEMGVAAEDAPLTRDDLALADELFFAGTGWEILPILRMDGVAIGTGRIGAMTLELARLYDGIVRGASGIHDDWLTEV